MQLDAALEKQGVKIDKVLNFEIDDSILEERITGRWIHPASGRSYHSKFAPPKVAGKDDVSSAIHPFRSYYYRGCFFLFNHIHTVVYFVFFIGLLKVDRYAWHCFWF